MAVETIEPLLPAAVAREHDAAPIGTCRLLDGDVEAILGEPGYRALRPFDDHRALAQSVIEAELIKLTRLQAIEIAMGQREVGQLVALHQRESRARHFGRAAKRRDQGAGKGRLAGAKRA